MKHSRRQLMKLGLKFGLGGTLASGLPDLCFPTLGLASQAQKASTAKRCILIWLDGGPSHLETFDPKPDASVEVRGPLQTIATAVPGVRLSECLPETATRMNDVAIVRSLTSPLGEHNFGTHYLLSGFKPTAAIAYPAFSTVAAELIGKSSDLPSHVAAPDYRVGGSNFSGYGYLPSAAKPFALGADPSKPDFTVRDFSLPGGITLDRLAQRREFVQEIERLGEQLPRTTEENPQLAQAVRLLTSKSARQAFAIEEESTRTRNRYGRKTVGQSCLLARRLIERGVQFVTINVRGWDTHEDLVTRLKDGYTGAKTPVGLVPSLDLAFTALIDDLKDRGLLDETLIVVMGEFGRTPKLNIRGGRDHWPRVFSAALAGGGVRGGNVVGTSDATGESPAENPVTPADLVCTIYNLLGIDLEHAFQSSDGRPIKIAPDGAKVVRELVSG